MAQGTDLKGKSVENTYENLIAIDNPGFDGADKDLRHLQDARGKRLPIQVQSVDGDQIVNITGVLQLNGAPLSINQKDIGAIRKLTNGAYIDIDGGTFE